MDWGDSQSEDGFEWDRCEDDNFSDWSEVQESDSDSDISENSDQIRRVRFGAIEEVEVPKLDVTEVCGKGYFATLDLACREFERDQVNGGCGGCLRMFEQRVAQIEEPDYARIGRLWSRINGEGPRPEELQEQECQPGDCTEANTNSNIGCLGFDGREKLLEMTSFEQQSSSLNQWLSGSSSDSSSSSSGSGSGSSSSIDSLEEEDFVAVEKQNKSPDRHKIRSRSPTSGIFSPTMEKQAGKHCAEPIPRPRSLSYPLDMHMRASKSKSAELGSPTSVVESAESRRIIRVPPPPLV